jgi:hypothetical protein
MSFHPRWRSTTGERIWLAGPAFMLVFPKQDRLELFFGDPPTVLFGRYLTMVGLLLSLAMAIPFVRRRIGVRAQKVTAMSAVRAIGALGKRWSKRTRHIFLIGTVAVISSIFALVAVAVRTSDVDTVYRDGMSVFDDQNRSLHERMSQSLAYFQKAQRLAPLSYSAIHSTYYESIALYRLERWQEAEANFERLIRTFPEAQAAAEAQYHIGICRLKRKDAAGAQAAWQETIRSYRASNWATYARERLEELK